MDFDAEASRLLIPDGAGESEGRALVGWCEIRYAKMAGFSAKPSLNQPMPRLNRRQHPIDDGRVELVIEVALEPDTGVTAKSDKGKAVRDERVVGARLDWCCAGQAGKESIQGRPAQIS